MNSPARVPGMLGLRSWKKLLWIVALAAVFVLYLVMIAAPGGAGLGAVSADAGINQVVPTRSPTLGDRVDITGTVRLQCRPEPPDDSYRDVWVRPSVFTTETVVYPSDIVLQTDGGVVVAVNQIGTYTVCVKGQHTLQVCVRDIDAYTWTNPIDFGELPEGDANDDNAIDELDGAALAAVYWMTDTTNTSVYMADFNGDGIVDYRDASMMAVNYGRSGDPLPIPSSAGAGAAGTMLTDEVLLGNVIVRPVFPDTSIRAGMSFDVDVYVDAGFHAVNALDVHLAFDPQYLQVTNKATAGDLTHIAGNRYDNVQGTINYGAYLPGGWVYGEFKLCTLHMRATATVESTGISAVAGPDVAGIHCDTPMADWQDVAIEVTGLGGQGTFLFLPSVPNAVGATMAGGRPAADQEH